jgi:glycosyltransferase involved in cell wall biosynthesis
MTEKKTVSVIISCLNEEENLRDTYYNVVASLQATMEDYEILIFDDGSRDRTGDIADDLAANDGRVTVFHNARNRGFGYSFIAGIAKAKMNYVIVIPGDNEISRESMIRIFGLAGTADIIIPFTVNTEVRPYARRLLSQLYTVFVNALFCCELQYYNGPALHRLDLVRHLDTCTVGFGFQTVLLVKLVRAGHSFREVDMYLQTKRRYRSTAGMPRNVLSVLMTIIRLFIDVQRDPALREFRRPNRKAPTAAEG